MRIKEVDAINMANYVDADKSDPFTRDRILCHLKNGIAKPDDYSAKLVKSVHTLPDGETYNTYNYVDRRRV